jgi:hypothetical protein
VRDIVWTVILVWVVWKIYDAFSSKAKIQNATSGNSQNRREGEVKIDKNVNSKSRFNSNDGEYVDYEEIK